jgi:hypothetical protein
MTTTLDDVTPRKKKPEPSAEAAAAAELVRLAKEQGLSLTGPDGLLKQLTKTVLETALNEEITEHLGYEKHDPAGVGAANIRNGTRAKTVLTESTGQVQIEVPRDRAGTFEPQIVKKRQRRLNGVDEIVLSLYAKGLTTREISAHFAEIYGASVSRETVSRITDKVIEEMTDWSHRPLDAVYAAVFIDAGGYRGLRGAPFVWALLPVLVVIVFPRQWKAYRECLPPRGDGFTFGIRTSPVCLGLGINSGIGGRGNSGGPRSGRLVGAGRRISGVSSVANRGSGPHHHRHRRRLLSRRIRQWLTQRWSAQHFSPLCGAGVPRPRLGHVRSSGERLCGARLYRRYTKSFSQRTTTGNPIRNCCNRCHSCRHLLGPTCTAPRSRTTTRFVG